MTRSLRNWSKDYPKYHPDQHQSGRILTGPSSGWTLRFLVFVPSPGPFSSVSMFPVRDSSFSNRSRRDDYSDSVSMVLLGPGHSIETSCFFQPPCLTTPDFILPSLYESIRVQRTQSKRNDNRLPRPPDSTHVYSVSFTREGPTTERGTEPRIDSSTYR